MARSRLTLVHKKRSNGRYSSVGQFLTEASRAAGAHADAAAIDKSLGILAYLQINGFGCARGTLREGLMVR